mmetsp:Transcript_12413/g.15526  ORF Transcript_12413/g.15526 Transcript_12413/m.15526 type:complete len:478 (-) Transcript_12413:88-1521(-)|eukprot:CAMPEP_0172507272 /NCGR_PEP_ID=MMETSP1066-20121228/202742_1 /TAXON_ID=671091 /ORGANISM="Coscinodiscus wailesii, Strain CCMP2513" /LENGTH=477 /DNA_ID=CAMNT_0013284771 /DNA_START=105 /DNA_END=1538 /DNA_ORIENTATION=-
MADKKAKAEEKKEEDKKEEEQNGKAKDKQSEVKKEDAKSTDVEMKDAEETAAAASDEKTKTPNGDAAKKEDDDNKDKNTKTPEEIAAITEKLGKRLHFFFSDANLRFDRFMRTNLAETKNRMTLETLLKFNSIRTITKDPEHLKSAVTEHCSDLLELHDDGKCIGRKNPFDFEKAKGGNIDLSLVITNVPVKDGRYEVPFPELYPLFEGYGTVAMVKYRFGKFASREEKRKSRGGRPTGEAFVEFSTTEELKKAAEELIRKDDESPKKTLYLKETELKIVTMRKWIEENEANKKATQNDDDDDGDKETKKRGRDDRDKDDDDEDVKVPEFKLDWKKGCVIRVKGLPEKCDREAILEMMKSYEEALDGMPYVDYSRGQKDGAIRFKEPKEETIKEICKKLKEGELKILDTKVEDSELLEGEEETKYWNEFIEFKNKQMKQRAIQDSQRRRRGGGGYRGRGGRGGRGGGGRGRNKRGRY